jgi:DNA adenine methylase
MDTCVIKLTESAFKYGNLNLRSCGKDFFPPDVFGGPNKKSGIGNPITLKVEGLAQEIQTDIPTDSKTHNPRWIFRERGWVKGFIRSNNLGSGDSVDITRLSGRVYVVTIGNARQSVREIGAKKRKPEATRKLIAFGWYGGKFSHLDWLLPLLPQTKHFCEVFGGSAAVILNRHPSPIETYNDIDGEVANFFQVLRDRGEELIRAIALTPFSREEFELAIRKEEKKISNFERARRFYVRARQVRTGLAQTATSGRWAHCRLTSRAEMAGAVSRWLGSVEDLPYIAQRLLRVQIENAPAIEVVQRYDSEDTLFYCDPPYVHDSRGDKNAYAYEMTDQDHRRLAHILNNVRGKVALSGYHCDLMDELYGDWQYIEAPVRNCHSVKSPRREVLWVNYPVRKLTKCQSREKSLTPLFDVQLVT